MKLWPTTAKLDRRAEKFTVGNDPVIDLEFIEYDCRASIAHARMLHKIGILSSKEARGLERELKKIISLGRQKKFKIRDEEEDAHTAIENHLTREIGPAGKKIHTGRSRNDQVLVAVRLYSKDRLDRLDGYLRSLIGTLSQLSYKTRKWPMPGYTHSRKAMPYSVGKYFGAFREAFKDDLQHLRDVYRLIDQNPLGSVAGYGTTLRLDRTLTTRLLGFRKTQTNELYAQNSRGKFESLILSALVQVLLDIERLANDLILFSREEFGYFHLPHRLTTGSSVMPQKRNPDVLEIARANFALVHSCYLQIIETIKGLPSGYHRDLQLIKEPLVRGFNKTIETVECMRLVLENLHMNRTRCGQACTQEINAAAEANELVLKGIPFRDAHRQIALKYK